MSEYLKRIDTSLLYPPFLAKVELLVQELADAGTPFYSTCGYRSVAEQDALYAKGRTAPGGKVTNAKGGFSAHQYGAASDFCRDGDLGKPGLQPDYKAEHYEVLCAAAEALGLEAGGHWTSIKDFPHIQMPLKSKGITWDVIKPYLDKGGLPEVWAFLDGFEW